MSLIDDPQMVMVEWEDSEMTEGWKSKPELLEYLSDSISIIQSVGWLLRDDDQYTVVAQSIDREHDSGFLACDLIKIPKSLVHSVLKLNGFARDCAVDPVGAYIVTPGFGKHEEVYDFDDNLVEIREIDRHHEIDSLVDPSESTARKQD